jgi:hypothetical protein
MLLYALITRTPHCAVSRHRIAVAPFHVSPATTPQINLLFSFPGSSPTANVAVVVPSFFFSFVNSFPWLVPLRPASKRGTTKFFFGLASSKLSLGWYEVRGWRCAVLGGAEVYLRFRVSCQNLQVFGYVWVWSLFSMWRLYYFAKCL